MILMFQSPLCGKFRIYVGAHRTYLDLVDLVDLALTGSWTYAFTGAYALIGSSFITDGPKQIQKSICKKILRGYKTEL